MAHKTITPEQLLELASSGAKISIDNKPTDTSKWESIIGQLLSVAKANEELVKKQSEEIKSTLNHLIEVLSKNKDNHQFDTGPIVKAIENIKLKVHTENKCQSYEFDIERNNRGLMSKIKVHPVN